MKNPLPLPELPERDPIDPILAAKLATLYDIDAVLFDAQCSYVDAQSATQRQAQCTAFAGALYELEGVVSYLQKYLAHMRNGITPTQRGRVIPLRRKQPRDARGRYVKRTT